MGHGRGRRPAIHRSAAAHDLRPGCQGSQARLRRPGADQSRQRAALDRRAMARCRADACRREPQGAATPDAGRRRGRYARATQGSALAVHTERARSIYHVVPNLRETAARIDERGFRDSALPRSGGRRLFRGRGALATGEPAQRFMECAAVYPDRRRGSAVTARSGTAVVHRQLRCAGGGLARNAQTAGLYRPMDRRLARHQTGWRPIARQTPRDRFQQRRGRRVAGDGLITNLPSARIPVQAIASGPNEQLQEFCRRTQTWCRNCVPEELVEMIEQAYLSLLARYEIAYQPVAAIAADVKVRL